MWQRCQVAVRPNILFLDNEECWFQFVCVIVEGDEYSTQCCRRLVSRFDEDCSS